MANRNQTEGAGKKVEGSIKEAAGKLTKDRDLEAKGKAKKVEGDVQKGVGNVQEDMKR